MTDNSDKSPFEELLLKWHESVNKFGRFDAWTSEQALFDYVRHLETNKKARAIDSIEGISVSPNYIEVHVYLPSNEHFDYIARSLNSASDALERDTYAIWATRSHRLPDHFARHFSRNGNPLGAWFDHLLATARDDGIDILLLHRPTEYAPL